MFIQTWGNIIFSSLEIIWNGFIAFIPSLIGAIIVFLIGMVVAVGLGKFAQRLTNILRIDTLLDKMGFGAPMERAGLKLNPAHFIGELVKWFLIVVFALAAFDILGLDTITVFLNNVLLYIPNIIVAVLIMMIAIIVANFLEKLVKTGVLASNLTHASFLGAITRWAILIFAIFASLIQLGIAPQLINTLFTGFVAMIAIGGGIAFGLGGKEYAEDLIGTLRKIIRK